MNRRTLNLVSLTAGLLLVFTSNANADCQAGRGLKNVMLDMNTLSKKLQAQLADATRNEDSANLVASLRDFTLESLPLCVTKLEGMADPAAKRIEYMEYQRLIARLFSLELDLEQALLKSDSAAAVTLFGQIKDLQRAAHSRMRGAATTEAQTVEFRIAKGTGKGAWNTSDKTVEVKIGDTLRFFNDDTVDHRLHTFGAPCEHGPTFKPGETWDCAIRYPFDPAKSGPLYDHEFGSKAEFWVIAR